MVYWSKFRYREPNDKPPAFSKAREEWLFEWTASRLQDFHERAEWRGYVVDVEYEQDLQDKYDAKFDIDAALRAFDQGDPEPLRSLHPKIARAINLDFRGQGNRAADQLARKQKHFDLDNQSARLMFAIEDVRVIRNVIWKVHYGRMNKAKGTVLSAEDIAARFWDVKVEAINSKQYR